MGKIARHVLRYYYAYEWTALAKRETDLYFGVDLPEYDDGSVKLSLAASTVVSAATPTGPSGKLVPSCRAPLRLARSS
jgi:hypothetical protein